MKNPRTIILEPILNEKSLALREKENAYTFKVAKTANKIEIKKAIEELFKVKVLNVNTQVKKGKKRRLGRFEGKRPDWKKAICKIKEGDKIEIFEGV